MKQAAPSSIDQGGAKQRGTHSRFSESAICSLTDTPQHAIVPAACRIKGIGERQWRQHTEASVFAGPFISRLPASRKQWDIAIADHADPGRVARSMLSPFGSPTPCESLRV